MNQRRLAVLLAVFGCSWAWGQEAVVKIGHVGPISGAIGHLG